MKQSTLTRIFYFMFGFIFILFGIMGYSIWATHTNNLVFIFGFLLSVVVGIGLVCHALSIKSEINKSDANVEIGEQDE